jgi:hypothetical protein
VVQSDLQHFYDTTSHILPPTSGNPSPSPFRSYLHAYTLISTRAFLIDLYHLIALTPFCDILNHSSSTPHTSLQSDDFVCHICGSLRTCSHDVASTSGVTRRLESLSDFSRGKLEKEIDTVDMVFEREVREGEEIWNSYGEGLGDGRLLVEWGFLGGEYEGEGITWEVEGICAKEDVVGAWAEIIGGNDLAGTLSDNDKDEGANGQDEHDTLLYRPKTGKLETLALNHNGQISTSLFALLHIHTLSQTQDIANVPSEALIELVRGSIAKLEGAWEHEDMKDRTEKLDRITLQTVDRVVKALEKRLSVYYRPEMTQDALFDLRDVSFCAFMLVWLIVHQSLPITAKLQRMAITLSVDERVLLLTALQKWKQVLTLAKE